VPNGLKDRTCGRFAVELKEQLPQILATFVASLLAGLRRQDAAEKSGKDGADYQRIMTSRIRGDSELKKVVISVPYIQIYGDNASPLLLL
jgi:hypothetical protein